MQVNLAHLLTDIVDYQRGSARMPTSLPGTPNLHEATRPSGTRVSQAQGTTTATIKGGVGTLYSVSRIISATGMSSHI